VITVIRTTLHTCRQRPWGWEVPATFTDDDGNEHNEVLLFRNGEPSEAEIEAAKAFWIARIEAVEGVKIEPEL